VKKSFEDRKKEFFHLFVIKYFDLESIHLLFQYASISSNFDVNNLLFVCIED